MVYDKILITYRMILPKFQDVCGKQLEQPIWTYCMNTEYCNDMA